LSPARQVADSPLNAQSLRVASQHAVSTGLSPDRQSSTPDPDLADPYARVRRARCLERVVRYPRLRAFEDSFPVLLYLRFVFRWFQSAASPMSLRPPLQRFLGALPPYFAHRPLGFLVIVPHLGTLHLRRGRCRFSIVISVYQAPAWKMRSSLVKSAISTRSSGPPKFAKAL
jgi:hypothetical protein